MCNTYYPVGEQERQLNIQNLIGNPLKRETDFVQNHFASKPVRNHDSIENLITNRHQTHRSDFFPPENDIEIIDLDNKRDQIKPTTWHQTKRDL